MDAITAYSLSPQQREWLRQHHRMNMPCAQLVMQVNGHINMAWLKGAIERVIDKDTIFRTTYTYIKGEDWPVQTLNDTAGFVLVENQVSMPLNEKDRLLKEAADHQFDLENGPLMRVDVIAGPALEQIVAVTMPALCADFCSLTVLADHIIAGYLSSMKGEPGNGNEVLPYLQFSEWQNQLMEAESSEDGHAYWRDQQQAGTPVIVSFDEDPYLKVVYEGSRFSAEMELPDAFDVASLEAGLGVCWQLLLWRLSGQQMVITGHTNSGRDFTELNYTIGLLSRCMPVAVKLAPEQTFGEALAAYSRALEANDLHKATYIPGHTHFSYSFEFADMHVRFADDAVFDILAREQPSVANKIHLCCIREGDKLQVHFQYNRQAFSKESIGLLAMAYKYMVQQCLPERAVRLADVGVLPAATIHSLQEQFNDTDRDFPYGSFTVDALWDEQVRLHPDATAVIAGNQRLSYRELQLKANALAAYLVQELHITAGDRVGLMCGENEKMIIGMLGIIKAGAAYVPLDPENPVARIQYILKDSATRLLITERSLQQVVPDYDGAVICLEDACATNTVIEHSSQRKTEDPAYVIYTSGTTGQPKGVMIPDRALVNYVCWLRHAFQVSSNDSALLLSSFAFDLGYTSIWGMLLNGGCLHLVPLSNVKEPDTMVSYIVQHGISFIKTTPSLLHVITNAGNVTGLGVSALRIMLVGGEPIRVRDLEQMVSIKPDIRLVNHYGPTESTIGTIAHLIDTGRLRQYAAQPVIGKPIANSYISILDEHHQPVAPGIAGELCIAGRGLSLGYLNREQLTSERFIPHPFRPDTLMYRTGDQAMWTAAGNILFIGRKDDQVKIRGYRVELNEVQQTLLQYNGIRQVAVLALDNEEFGKELTAYYESDSPYTVEQLREYLSARLPEPMVPTYLVWLKKLPLTANGKLDKKALPAITESSDNAAYVAPGNEMEKQMAVIWEMVLGKTMIGIKSNFFDLGGHSLKAIQLASQVHKKFNVKIDLAKIFAYPTIEQLSAFIAGAATRQFNSIPQLQARPYYELSHAQQRLWVLSRFDSGAAAYNVPGAVVLEGPLQVDGFRRSLMTLIARHENLRTVFLTVDETPMQKVLPADARGFELQERDLRVTPDATAIAETWMKEDADTPFDLENGPLLRATLIRMAEEQYIFLFTVHHIVSDGWSRGLLTKELMHLYTYYTTGRGNELPALRIQYKDFAAWHTGIFEEQGSYWKQLYRDGIPVLDFPLDFRRPETLTFTGSSLSYMLPPGITAGLRRLAQSRNTTLNNLMFALYGLLISHYSKQEDLVIGSLVSGRNHVDLENVMGVFINFLPVRLSVAGEELLEDYLERTHKTLLQAYRYQDYPFDLMVDNCMGTRDVSRNPFFDTMLVFHAENDLHGRGNSHPDIRMRLYKGEQKDDVRSVLDFKLDVYPAGEELELYFTFNSRLFTRERMQTFLQRYVSLLTDVTEQQGQSLLTYLPWTAEPSPLAGLPVNICASFVAEPLEEYLNYWSRELNLDLQPRFAPYNQVFQQMIDKDSILYNNKGINVLFIRPEDWLRDNRMLDAAAQQSLLEATCNELMSVARLSREQGIMPCLVALVPPASDSGLLPDVHATLHKVMQALTEFFAGMPGFYLVDLMEAATLYAVEEIFDSKADEAGHMPFTPEYYAVLGTYIARKVRAWKTTPFKVIAVDCDNTMWGGICGEAGAEEVLIDENFSALQRFLLKKYEEGFLLTIVSKNNEGDVWEVFDKHPGMLLQRSHFAAHRINWNDKAENLRSLAAALNLGLDSFIFLDDSPFEVGQVSAGCPEVLAMQLPEEPGEIGGFLEHNWAFDRLHITAEDRERNAMYRAEKERQQAQADVQSLDEFVSSLNIRVHVLPLEETDIERAVQLTQRTNQFNMNGIQLSMPAMMSLTKKASAYNRIIKVEDRFGNYGISGLLLGSIDKEVLELHTFLLSCRVLGRGVEDAVLSALRQLAVSEGLHTLSARFIPTEKNKPFSAFLERTHWTESKHEGVYTLTLKEK